MKELQLKVLIERPKGGRSIITQFLRETIRDVDDARELAEAYRRANPYMNIIGEFVHREAV